MDALIVGIDNAAKYLQCGRSTVKKFIQLGEFPKPIHTSSNKRGKSRIWTAAELDKFKTKPVGNPNFKKI